MKCPSEFTWSVYVDGELSPDELRGAEMHLVACRDCRGRVVALQEEVPDIGRSVPSTSRLMVFPGWLSTLSLITPFIVSSPYTVEPSEGSVKIMSLSGARSTYLS